MNIIPVLLLSSTLSFTNVNLTHAQPETSVSLEETTEQASEVNNTVTGSLNEEEGFKSFNKTKLKVSQNNCFEIDIDLDDELSCYQMVYGKESSLEISFINPEGREYKESELKEQANLTYIKKENPSICNLTENGAVKSYNLTTLYLEHFNPGKWKLKVSYKDIPNIIFDKVEPLDNWQTTSEETIRYPIDTVNYLLDNEKDLEELLSTEKEGQKTADKQTFDTVELEYEKPNYYLYGALLIGLIVVAGGSYLGFILYKKKKQEKKDRKEKEKFDELERIEKRKLQEEKFIAELKEKYSDNKWDDIEVNWSTEPDIIEMEETENPIDTIKQAINKSKQNNIIITKEEITADAEETQIPNIEDIKLSTDSDDFF